MSRIALVTPSLAPLAPTGQLTVLANGLADRGHELHVFVLDRHRVPDPLLKPEIGVHPLDWPENRFSPAALWNLQRELRQWQCTHVHLWHPSTPPWLPLLVGSTRGVRWWLTEVATGRPQLMHNDVLCWYLAGQGLRWILYHESIQQDLASGSLAPLPMECISPGLLPAPDSLPKADRQYWLRRLQLPPNAKLISTVSPLIPKARLKDLIWALDLLKCIRDDVYLVIVGEGHQQWRLEKFCSQTEIQEQVRFLPWNDLARELVAASDLYWQASHYFPQSEPMAWAMHLGTPVVTIAGPQTMNFLRHQHSAFLVEPGARNELARCARRLLDHPDIARAHSQSAQQDVREHFDANRMLDAYESIVLGG